LSAAGMVSQQGVTAARPTLLPRRSQLLHSPSSISGLGARRRRAGFPWLPVPHLDIPRPGADGTRARHRGFLKLPAMRTESARDLRLAARRRRGRVVGAASCRPRAGAHGPQLCAAAIALRDAPGNARPLQTLRLLWRPRFLLTPRPQSSVHSTPEPHLPLGAHDRDN
jgi:hypothetical protein